MCAQISVGICVLCVYGDQRLALGIFISDFLLNLLVCQTQGASGLHLPCAGLRGKAAVSSFLCGHQDPRSGPQACTTELYWGLCCLGPMVYGCCFFKEDIDFRFEIRVEF